MIRSLRFCADRILDGATLSGGRKDRRGPARRDQFQLEYIGWEHGLLLFDEVLGILIAGGRVLQQGNFPEVYVDMGYRGHSRRLTLR